MTVGLPTVARTMIFEFVHQDFLIAVAMKSCREADFAIALAPAAIETNDVLIAGAAA